MTTFTITFDPQIADYPWDVVDSDGDVLDSFETEAEAVQDATERQAEAEAEAREERLAELRAKVAELVDDVDDEAALAAVVEMLRAGR